ncbi:hypothetical protein [Clostridium paridis]|uniref:DUF2680 domain-containing protein n=1 Tax=Clostridium paridis TaxID=2803863 RepID=A0A937FDB9_9CLOT|nr:hypothetical protein [Clostridium paridis]MBL4931764.1 hypothetical protein [Clostridium paridis]
MKIKNIVLSLAIVSVIGVGTTAYAATSSSASESNLTNQTCSGVGLGRVTNMRGYDILTNLLKSKGATDEEISSSLNSGKSLYDLLKEKGVTDEQIKEYMVNEKTKGIDEAVASGKFTKMQGEELKEDIKENSANCTTPGQGNSNMRGMENRGNSAGGRMGMHRS